uniref:Pentapeptide repeat family protein n=1 Tax=Adineta vaga TaxID=104782 RepID=G3KGV0_ADIVA|nr:pentapeptide repeat family protein [Adineta vaga]
MRISVGNSVQMAKKLNRLTLVKLFFSALIPLTIGLFTVITTIQQQKSATAQREQDKQDALLLRQQSDLQAENLHKEKVYATYLDDVSELFTMNNSKDTLMKIRAKTLATLRQLDMDRKKHLLLFLYDSELIYHSPEKTISSVLRVDEADLNGVYFRGTVDASCSFMYLYLHYVYLSNASFINCFIDRSNFSFSIMYKTVFTKTRFLRTSFRFALLGKADFSLATFFEMDFIGASLVECNFTGARWVKKNTDFIGTNLTGAIISNELLKKSKLYNSILPNGTWGPILGRNLVVNGNAERNVSI